MHIDNKLVNQGQQVRTNHERQALKVFEQRLLSRSRLSYQQKNTIYSELIADVHIHGHTAKQSSVTQKHH